MKILAVKKFIFPAFLFCSCAAPTEREQESNTQSVASPPSVIIPDSVNQATGLQPDSGLITGAVAPRNNVTALVNGKNFKSISFSVNDLEVNKDTVYSIYATDGEDRIIINYRGKPVPGTYDMRETADAIFMTKDNKLFKGVNGNISFSRFDLKARMISGRFNFISQAEDHTKAQIEVANGEFVNLEIQ